MILCIKYIHIYSGLFHSFAILLRTRNDKDIEVRVLYLQITSSLWNSFIYTHFRLVGFLLIHLSAVNFYFLLSLLFILKYFINKYIICDDTCLINYTLLDVYTNYCFGLEINHIDLLVHQGWSLNAEHSTLQFENAYIGKLI